MKQFYMKRKFWKEVKKFIPPKKSIRRPRAGSKKIMSALYYIFRTGIRWKALPISLFRVSASTVHRRYQEWISDGVFRNFWISVLKKYQIKHSAMSFWLATDTISVKSPLGGEDTGFNPTDRRKIGTKRSSIVDQNGIVFGAIIAPANTHDSKLLLPTLASIPVGFSDNLKVFAADAAYDTKAIKKVLLSKNFIPLIAGNKRKSKEEKPKTSSRNRWIVERTQSHFNRWRSLLIRWNKKSENYLAIVHFVAAFQILEFL